MTPEPAPTPPVAAVVVDTGLPHLDRVFEYAVPAELSDAAQPGCRVRVRFAGRDLDGFVVERRAHPDHPGRLASLRRVVSPESVLTPEILTLCRAVADHHAGVLGDVLRLAVPKRHAAAERGLDKSGPPTPAIVATPELGPWSTYPAGEALLRRIAGGESPAAAWLAVPGRPPEADWPRALAVAAATAVAAGRGALVVVPDHRDVDRVDRELAELLGPGQHARLTADQGPQARYTAWLKVLRGHVRCVVGTRAAAFAPLHDLGLVAWWDDGDDLLEEPRAPYPHVRDVLRLRATQSGAALLTGGFARSVAVQQLVEDGALVPVHPRADALRAAAPRVHVAGDDLDRSGPAALARLPPFAWRTAKAALAHGPVLVQVPRRGYLPALACQHCREPARCARCHGPMGMPSGGSVPACHWCGATYGPEGFVCPECDGRELRSTVVGARRTAEELGRAFPGVPVRTSGSGDVLASVSHEPALVIATPGAEPVADGRYAATLLLDGWALLDRSGLDAAMEALRRWL
ncbi:MAG TPA: primosome assembly protein PriA, partial [Lapillicoccus sp.]|nr:primosome assembly protein PriA [Lapillicoccus sp.]